MIRKRFEIGTSKIKSPERFRHPEDHTVRLTVLQNVPLHGDMIHTNVVKNQKQRSDLNLVL